MIWRLVGFDKSGDEQPVAEYLVSADFIQDGTAIIVCPLEGPMTDSEAAATAETLKRADIKAVVFKRPIQVWKIEPAAPATEETRT